MFHVKLWSVLLAIPVMLTLAAGSRADTGPMDTTRQFVDQALKILADKQTPVAQRSAQLRQLLEPNFDFTEMSRSALGYHWKQLSPTQRANFTEVFKSFIESAYSSKINEYSGQKVQFIKEASLGSGYAQVFTNIVQAGKSPIAVNYLLEQKDDGWKVYDVTVDNISIIANYRNQFNRVINENGFDKLLADLKSKEQQINASMAG
jgi:phospholipid transport system substrate-binding protein